MRNFKEKLKGYGVLAGTVIGATSAAEAEIIDTTINPDSVVSDTFFILDLNNDSIYDFVFQHRREKTSSTFTWYGNNLSFYYKNYGVLGYAGSGNKIANTTVGSSYTAVEVNNSGELISSGKSWGYYAPMALDFTYFFLANGTSVLASTTAKIDMWRDQTDKYVGLKLNVDGEDHYGWVRLDVDSSLGSFTVKSYAFQDIAEVPIKAGDTTYVLSDSASNVAITQIGPSGGADDIQISFDKALVEDAVGEYRVVLVKSSKAASFNLDSAKNLRLSTMHRVTPTGNNIVDTLGSNTVDADGDPIVPFQAYKAFVMSAPDGDSTTEAVLSYPSPELTLGITAASKARNLVAADIGGNDNGSDLNIKFDTATYQPSIFEYRALVVKETKADAFTLDSAQVAVDSGYYLPIPTEHDSIVDTVFNASSVDTDGETITLNVPYKVFIFSVPDSVIASQASLSDSSNTVTLQIDAPDTVMSVEAYDWTEQGNGADVNAIFRPSFTNDDNITDYKIITVKSSKADTFDLDKANQVMSNGDVYSVAKTEPLYLWNGDTVNIVTLDATSTDSDGDLITTGVPYKLFVLTVGDETTDRNSLSPASNEVTLQFYYADAATDVFAQDVQDFQNGNDLQVTFNTALYSETVSEYNLVAVKSQLSAAFDLTAAETAVSNGYFKKATYTASDSTVNVRFSANSRDSDGDFIAENMEYNIFVVSIPDGSFTSLINMSEMSNGVILTSSTDGVADKLNSSVDVILESRSILIKSKSADKVNYQLLDMNGRILNSDSFKGDYKVELNGLSKGIYVLEVYNDRGEKLVRKVSVN